MSTRPNYGIAYEVWAAPKIRNKLRPHERIVATYTDPAEHWVRVICGKSLSPYPPAPSVSPGYISAINDAIIQTTINSSVEMERELEEHRTMWRQGQRRKALRWARGITKDDRWHQLTTESKTKLLCFSASVELDLDRIDAAKRLLSQARKFESSYQVDRLRAKISFHENNIQAAITFLEGSQDVSSLDLLAAIYLESQDLQKAHSLLSSMPLVDAHNPETYRLKAWYHLINRDIDQAQTEINDAMQLQSSWTLIQFASATIDYYRAVAINALPSPLWPAPQPVPWALIKRDKNSLLLLHKAGRVFKRLLDDHELNDQMSNQVKAWYLACLASHPDYQIEANAYCRDLIGKDPDQPLFVEWAVARQFEVNFESSKKALQELVGANNATPAHVQALYHLYAMEQEPDVIIQLLDQTESLFEDTSQKQIWGDWYGRAIFLKDGAEATLKYIEQSEFAPELEDLRILALCLQAEEKEDWEVVKFTLTQKYGATKDPYWLFILCEQMAQQEEWETIVEWGDQLLELIPTGEGVSNILCKPLISS